MRHEVKAVDPSTGERLTLVVEAPTREAAEMIVRAGGMVLSREMGRRRCDPAENLWAHFPFFLFLAAFIGGIIWQPPPWSGRISGILGSLVATAMVAYIPAGIAMILMRWDEPEPEPVGSRWNPVLPRWLPWALLAAAFAGVAALLLAARP